METVLHRCVILLLMMEDENLFFILGLYNKGLVYFDVKIHDSDYIVGMFPLC